MSNNNLCYLVKARVGVRGNRKKTFYIKGKISIVKINQFVITTRMSVSIKEYTINT
jgi:hypothetical protein